MIRKVLLALLVSSACYADQVAVANFKYLNSNENSTIIDANEAQSLLNVDITPGGKSVKKRDGYGIYKTVFSISSGTHGGFHGFDASGNDVQIWGGSVSVKGVVADATPNTIISSMTVNSTIDCADTQGFFYCVNSSRNFYIKTNGTTLDTWFASPLGTMVEATPDRIVVAGVGGTPNTLHVSGSNAFTTFTVGPLTTDPFTEVIAAPGSRLTHIRWGCQKLLWWKDQSFGYFDFEDQYAAQVKTISDSIGTLDNTSAIDPGGSVWFRGQDGHIYEYNCSGLVKQTIEISPQIQTSGRRTSNLYTQGTQAEFQTGTISPTGQLSTTLAPSEVVPSSFTATDTSASDFATGTLSNLQTTAGGVIISTNNTTYANSWQTTGGTWNTSFSNPYDNCGTMTDKGGDGFAIEHANETSDWSLIAKLVEHNTDVVISSMTIPFASSACSWTQRTFVVSAANARKRAYIAFSCSLNSGHEFRTNPANSFLLSGTNPSFWTASDMKGGAGRRIFIDGAGFTTVDNGVSTITEGSIVSRTFNTGITKSYASLGYSATVNDLTPAFTIQDSADGSAWNHVGTLSSTSYQIRQYVRYLSTFTVTGSSDALTTLDDVSLVSRSSGTYYSPVVNKPNLAAWSTLNVTYQNNNGSHTFYLRSSTSPFTVLNATPSWTAQNSGSVISIATGTYFQFRDDFGVVGSTHNPTMSDFQVNWFEGTASDQAYLFFFNDAIWASVSYGVGISSNNYIFRRDLINGGWTLYNFGTAGMLIQNNRMYFGSPTDGSVYIFGANTSDNGNSINSYWKSKDFTSPDPFMQTNLTQIDAFAKQNTGQSLTATYVMDTSTSTSYAINLSTSTQSYIQSRKLLPSGKNGYTFNFKFGDTSTTSAWEVFGFRIVYTVLPWKPTQ